ncbi:MAG: hypothetical protein OEV78_02510 [Spirochaetia bacterium]|nr:hypothetical protein [Spirochaetia bacterium]
MKAWKLSLAKITSPDTSAAFPRKRLFDLLDKSVKSPVVWIAAQGGSGKTTLVSSWLHFRKAATIWYQIDEGDSDIASFFYYMGLAAQKIAPKNKQRLPLFTPEYSLGLPVFTRRYFENLYSRLLKARKGNSPCVIVLDNYHHLPPESLFHEMMSHALDILPEGVRVIFTSRTMPPAALARTTAQNRLRLLRWEDIRFNREEFAAMLTAQMTPSISSEDIDKLYGQTDGWVAGLILLMAGAKASGVNQIASLSKDQLFDYFAAEIFSKTDITTRDFLIKTSFLEKLDVAVARDLSGNSMAARILENFSRNHFFTQKNGDVYQYHNLFRDFLQHRAREILSPDEINSMLRETAALLEQSGSHEEAVVRYLEICDWDRAERIILPRAETLSSQGRGNTLEAWLKRFPQEFLENSPWLQHWLGNCRMAYNPGEARGYMEKAYELFKSANNPVGLFLSWSKIVDSFVHEWGDARPADHWINELSRLTQQHSYPSFEVEAMVTASMVGILVHRQPSHPDFTHWQEKLEKIVLNFPDGDVKLLLGSHLMNSYNYVSGTQKAVKFFQSLQQISRKKNTSPLFQLMWCLQEANYLFMTGEYEYCEETITWGLNVSEKSGIHLLDPYILTHGIFGGVSYNRPDRLKFYREKFYRAALSPRLLDKSLFHYTEATIEWYEKKFEKALEHGRVAIEYAEAADCPWILAFCYLKHSVTLLDLENYEEAKIYHLKGGDYGKNIITGFLYNIIGARINLKLGNLPTGLQFLAAAFKLGLENKYTFADCQHDQTMSRLCAIALEHEIEPDYVRFLIQKRNLVPDFSMPIPENWPYPLKIITLGKFEIIKNDEILEFSGKVQQKPLALLKLLIAYGSKNVNETQISDVLWPDASGDSAHSSFAMALHRLRKLIGDDVIELSEGRLTLNQGMCSVDVFVLEKKIKMAENAWATLPLESEKALDLTMQAVNLYQEGSFLPGADHSLFITGFREKLSGKIRRILVSVSTYYESCGNFEKALAILDQAHLFDDLSEELIQRMMLCHLQLGRNSEAVQLFQSWRDRMMLTLNSPPSEKTMEIYNGLVN